MRRLVVLALVAPALTGCGTTTRKPSAAYERCRAENVAIENENNGIKAHNEEVHATGVGRIRLEHLIHVCLP